MKAGDAMAGELSRLSGRIEAYQCVRADASFVFSTSDQNALGVVAIAAGLAGLSGQAIATASHATSAEEPADHVSFMLGGQAVKGWVWRSPFNEGDVVDVVGEPRGDHFELVAIRRTSDRTIALYPHCSRGRLRHIRNAVFWWLVGATLFAGGVEAIMLLMGSWTESIEALKDGGAYADLGIYAFFALVAFSMARKWMPFARVAERVFRALDMPNPGSVDLVKSSRRQRKAEDPGEFGTFYFRY